MAENSISFVEFKTIKIDSTVYVELKSICETLDVDYESEVSKAKSDTDLEGYLVEVDDIYYLASQFVYGWMFLLNSKNADFLKWKTEAYSVIAQHAISFSRV